MFGSHSGGGLTMDMPYDVAVGANPARPPWHGVHAADESARPESKMLRHSGVTIVPKLDVFNVLNSDDYMAVASFLWGAPTYHQPAVILQGRLIRIGASA